MGAGGEQGVLVRAQEGGVLTLTLNRPGRRNALDPELRDALAAALAVLVENGRYEQVLTYEEPSMYFGGVNAVGRTAEGLLEAAADPRRSGGVAFV